MSDKPLSEQFRLCAKEWVEQDGAARLLDELKSATLAQRIGALGDMPYNQAERLVKSSPEWADYINQMVGARTKANLLKAKMEWIRMKHAEQQSSEASRRAEMRL